MDYVIYKGSITIDELLASQLCDEQTVVFRLYHSLHFGETILGFAHIGTEVNLETVGRIWTTIRHFMNLGSEPTEKPKIYAILLVENGYISKERSNT